LPFHRIDTPGELLYASRRKKDVHLLSEKRRGIIGTLTSMCRMNRITHYCRTLLALALALSLTSCGVAMTDGQKWLDSKTDAPEMNIAGQWVSPEWGDANFKQEKKDVSGMLGDYPVRGVVSGNQIYLLMYAGDKVHYSAKLKASDENNFEGFYSKYSIIDEPRTDRAYIRPITLRRVGREVTPSDTGAARSQTPPESKRTQEPVAAAPKQAAEAKPKSVTLRNTPSLNFSENDLYRSIKEHNFFSKSYNSTGDFVNDFVDNGDGTVTDRVTGLMWQKEGTTSEVSFGGAQQYVQGLNTNRFRGFADWRLPTAEELCSLLEPGLSQRGQHIDIVFSPSTLACWSSDQRVLYGSKHAYVVYFGKGDVEPSRADVVASAIHFVRAVRTAS